MIVFGRTSGSGINVHDRANTPAAAPRAVANSGPLEVRTRVGFHRVRLLHLAVAWLALQIVTGKSTGASDQSGAFATMARQPFGRLRGVLIVVIVASPPWPCGSSCWRHRAPGGAGAGRVPSNGSPPSPAVIYAAGLDRLPGVIGNPTSSADQQQSATAGMLAHPSAGSRSASPA